MYNNTNIRRKITLKIIPLDNYLPQQYNLLALGNIIRNFFSLFLWINRELKSSTVVERITHLLHSMGLFSEGKKVFSIGVINLFA